MTFYKDLKDQELLLPPNIRDLIPENHICFLVDEIVQKMDLMEYEKQYEGAGHPAYHPKLMLKLLILGMIDSIRSSRKLARSARENVVYMYLAGLLQPDFRTINEFRKNNFELVRLAFQDVVKYAKDLGMVSLGHICIDGTKIKANASNHSAVKKDDLSDLNEMIRKEIEEGIRIDEAEDELYGDKNADELPDGNTRKTIIERVREKYQAGDEHRKDKIKKQIEKVEKESEKADSAISFTDPECRFMKNSKDVIEYSYNPQVAVDSSSGIIISNDVTSEATDSDNLQPQINQVEENVGELPEGTKVSSDNGYYSSLNLKFLKEKGLDGYIPDQNTSTKMKGDEVTVDAFSKENFGYDVEEDCFICPNGKKLTFRFEYRDITKNRNVRIYKGILCKQCPDREKCAGNSRDGKVIKDYEGMEIERRRMKEKMESAYGRVIYQTRKKVVEPVFGHIKSNLGFREFLLRGKIGAKIEFNLACIATNLRRMWNFMSKNSVVVG